MPNKINLTIMKKVFMIAIVGGAFVMTSCKKDYTCACTIAGQTSNTVWTDIKKSDAQDACDALDVTATFVGGSCELK